MVSIVLINGIYSFKDLKAVSNSSVVKSESLMVSLKDIKYSVKLVENGRIFFAREGPISHIVPQIVMTFC